MQKAQRNENTQNIFILWGWWELSHKNDHLFSLKFSHKNSFPPTPMWTVPFECVLVIEDLKAKIFCVLELNLKDFSNSSFSSSTDYIIYERRECRFTINIKCTPNSHPHTHTHTFAMREKCKKVNGSAEKMKQKNKKRKFVGSNKSINFQTIATSHGFDPPECCTSRFIWLCFSGLCLRDINWEDS